MTLAIETIEPEIYACALLAGENQRVIFYYPNAPRPLKPYTSYMYRGMTTPQIIKIFDKDAEVYKLYSCNEVTYQVDCYSDNRTQALDEANRLIAGWIKQSTRWRLAENIPIGIWRTTDPVNTTTLIDSDYETRATFEIVFNISIEDGSSTDDVGYFDQVGPILRTI